MTSPGASAQTRTDRLKAVAHLRSHHWLAYREARRAGANRDLLLAVSAACVHESDCSTRGNPADQALQELAMLLRDGHSRDLLQDLVASVATYHGHRPTHLHIDLRQFGTAIRHPATPGNPEWEASRDWGVEFVRIYKAHGPFQAQWDGMRRKPLECSDTTRNPVSDSWVALVNAAGVHGVPVDEVAPNRATLLVDPRHWDNVYANAALPDNAYWAEILDPVLASWAIRGGCRTMQLFRAGIPFDEADRIDADDDTLHLMAALRVPA